MSAITITLTNNHRQVQTKTSQLSLIINKPIMIIVGIIIIALIATQLIISNYLATKGTQLNKINLQIDDLQKKNVQLNVSIAGNSSLTYIEKQAESQGMKKATNYLYINKNIPLALK